MHTQILKLSKWIKHQNHAEGLLKLKLPKPHSSPSTLFLIQQMRPECAEVSELGTTLWEPLKFRIHTRTHQCTHRYVMNTAPATWDALNNLLMLSFLFCCHKKNYFKGVVLRLEWFCAYTHTPARTFMIFFIVTNWGQGGQLLAPTDLLRRGQGFCWVPYSAKSSPPQQRIIWFKCQ